MRLTKPQRRSQPPRHTVLIRIPRHRRQDSEIVPIDAILEMNVILLVTDQVAILLPRLHDIIIQLDDLQIARHGLEFIHLLDFLDTLRLIQPNLLLQRRRVVSC